MKDAMNEAYENKHIRRSSYEEQESIKKKSKAEMGKDRNETDDMQNNYEENRRMAKKFVEQNRERD